MPNVLVELNSPFVYIKHKFNTEMCIEAASKPV